MKRKGKTGQTNPPIPSAPSAVPLLTAQVRTALNRSAESQYSICQALGLARSQLSRFASGKRELSAANLNKLAAHLGLRVV